MPESQRVAVRDLRLALDRLLAEVERTGGPEIDLAADPYWVVAAADAFALGTPLTPAVGQLADDLESLAAQVADDASNRWSGTTLSTSSVCCAGSPPSTYGQARPPLRT
jgi:hypothetical protein